MFLQCTEGKKAIKTKLVMNYFYSAKFEMLRVLKFYLNHAVTSNDDKLYEKAIAQT